MQIVKLAKRNIFRNSRRTLLTLLLISSCLVAMLFTDSFTRGMQLTMIQLSTDSLMGQAQIHREGYRDNPDVDAVIPNFSQLKTKLDKAGQVQSYASRAISGAMFSSAYDVSGGLLYGVVATQESQVTDIDTKIVEGAFLSGGKDEIIIGKDLADRLQISLGDRFVATLSRAQDGELAQVLFRVSGIFSFGDRNLDSGLAFANYQVVSSALAVTSPHEVAVRFNQLAVVNEPDNPVWAIKDEGQSFVPWFKIAPELASVLDLTNYSTLITSMILFVLVAFSVTNTMFMSIFERQREFGIQLAVGTNRSFLMGQIIAEGAIIGCIGAFIGIVLGVLVITWGSIYGIEYSEIEFSGVTVAKPIYTLIDVGSVLSLSFALWLVVVLACIYPAVHASRLSPAIAMRSSL